MGVVVLSQIFDEFHDFNAEPIGFDPQFELGMLSFYFGNQVEKHTIHLVTDVVELLRAEVWIVIDERLDF